MRWAAKPSIAPVLSGLADGSIPLTHQALDELPQRPALAHLRQTLVAIGALPCRDEEMARLEAFLHGLPDAQPGPERRRLLHRYPIWHLVRRTRSRNNGKPATRQQALLTRRLARGAIAFLDWLDSADLTLGNCQQADLHGWLASGQAIYREETGRLIRRAHAARLTSCYLPSAARWTGPAAILDGEDRWETLAGCCTTTRSSPKTGSPGFSCFFTNACPQATGRPTPPTSAAGLGTSPFHLVTKPQASRDHLCPLPCHRTRYSGRSNSQLCRYGPGPTATSPPGPPSRPCSPPGRNRGGTGPPGP